MRLRLAAAAAITCALAAGATTASADVVAPGKGNSQVAGRDRYATAVAVSKKVFTPGTAGVPVVAVATGADFPDGLASSSAAGAVGGPLLLTPTTTLRADVKAELQRLKPKMVLIAGATPSVSGAVEKAIRAAVPTAAVVRAGGANRYATAAEISKQVFATGGLTVFITSGKVFADAVSAASPAALTGGPLLLADTTLPAATRAELVRQRDLGKVGNVVVLGSTASVSQATFDAISAIFGNAPDGKPKTFRLAGADRYATSALMAGSLWGTQGNPAATGAYYANGAAWPDALSAGAAAAAHDMPVVLTKSRCMPAPTKAWDAKSAGTLQSRTWVGGQAAPTTAAC